MGIGIINGVLLSESVWAFHLDKKVTVISGRSRGEPPGGGGTLNVKS